MEMKVNIYVRKMDTGEVVKTISLSNTSERHVEMVVRGLLRNMDTSNFYVDDSEADGVKP